MRAPAKTLYYLSVAILSALLCYCTERIPLAGDPQFASFIGLSTTLKRDVLFLPAEGEMKKWAPGVDGSIHDKDHNNDWRTHGWIKAGEPIRILEINRYLTDTRGRWIGVIGEVSHPSTGAKIKVKYCWSLGSRIGRAPWEDAEVPEFRSAQALQP
jgi:hypothetical protein